MRALFLAAVIATAPLAAPAIAASQGIVVVQADTSQKPKKPKATTPKPQAGQSSGQSTGTTSSRPEPWQTERNPSGY